MPRNAFLLLTLIPLAACGGLSGTYDCDDIGFLKSVELTGDGKVFAEANIYGTAQKTAGTYEVEGERLIANVSGQSSVFDIKGGALVLGNGKCTRR